jgi:hypothetical protein
MLPSEIMLMAHGWPRKAAPGAARDAAGGGGAGAGGPGSSGAKDPARLSLELQSLDEEEYYLPGGDFRVCLCV